MMGQGIYTMIGLGVTNPPIPVRDGTYLELHEIFGDAIADKVRQDYEAQPMYIVVPLAVSDKFLAGLWKIPCFAREVISPSSCYDKYRADIKRACKIWCRAQEAAMKRVGMELGDPGILFICDWD